MTRRRIPVAAAAMVALALLASACGRSLSSANSTTGNVSPTANLVATTPAGAKPVSQAVWADKGTEMAHLLLATTNTTGSCQAPAQLMAS